MASGDPQRAQMPTHLSAGARSAASAQGALGVRVDPFARPGGARSRAVDPRTAVPGAFTAARRAAEAVAAADASGQQAFFACPCEVEHDQGRCGAPTTMLAVKVASRAAGRLLRCARCLAAGHLPTAPVRGRSAPAAGAAMPVVALGEAGRARSAEDAALDAQVAREVEDAKWARAQQTFEGSLPEKFARAMPAGEALEKAVEDRLARLGSGEGGHRLSLLCIGPYGCGKTWVSYSLARTAVARRLLWPSEIVHGTEAEVMEPLWRGGFQEMRDHTARLFHPRVRMILIDDIGATATYKDAEARHALFTKVINHAWSRGLAVVLSTNKEMGAGKSLERHIGVTAYERLKHMVGPDVVFRDKNLRASLTEQWEAEYQANLRALGSVTD